MDYRDIPYDVALPISLTAGQSLTDVPIEILNPSAPWFWTGSIYLPDADSGNGALSIAVKDAVGRSLCSAWPPDQQDDIPVEAVCGINEDKPVGTPEKYLEWPRNSRVRLNLRETTGTDPIAVMLVLRGFLRYRKVAAC